MSGKEVKNMKTMKPMNGTMRWKPNETRVSQWFSSKYQKFAQNYSADEKKKNKGTIVRKSPSFSHRKGAGKTRALSYQFNGERSLVPQSVPARGPSLFQGVQEAEQVVRPRGGKRRERNRPGMPNKQVLGQRSIENNRTGFGLFFFSTATDFI